MHLLAPVVDARQNRLWQDAKELGYILPAPVQVQILVASPPDDPLRQLDRRHWHRYALDDANATLFVRDLGQLSAGLLTLSAGGACFRTFTDLPSGTPMCIQIYNPLDQCSEFVDVRVIHSQRRADGICIAGGQFPIPLGVDLLRALMGTRQSFPADRECSW